MEEELHLMREYYVTGARKNLAEERFWNHMTVKHGGKVPELPAGMRELSRLSAIEYKPNLEDGRRRICWFYIFYSLFQLKGTVTLHKNYNVRLAFKSTVMMTRYA
jgi:hypothetical protein